MISTAVPDALEWPILWSPILLDVLCGSRDSRSSVSDSRAQTRRCIIDHYHCFRSQLGRKETMFRPGAQQEGVRLVRAEG